MGHLNNRFNETSRLVKAVVEQGELGEIYYYEARLYKDVQGVLVEAVPKTRVPGRESAQAHFVR
jgi:hypothetical protein